VPVSPIAWRVVALKEFVPQSIQRYKFVTALKEMLKEFGVTNL